MNIEVFVLCSAANDSGGNLNLLGAFNTIFTQTVPLIYPACTVALRLRVGKDDQENHKLSLNMRQSNGQLVISQLNVDFKVELQNPDEPSVMNFLFNLAALQFVSFGIYSLDLEIDGGLLASTPLLVKKISR